MATPKMRNGNRMDTMPMMARGSCESAQDQMLSEQHTDAKMCAALHARSVC